MCSDLTVFLRRLSVFAAFLSAVLSIAPSLSHAQDVLAIGDKAPALDIEHWMSDRDGQFSEFTGFENDKVYVVEFWATWCRPCITLMPHLVEVQNEYADKGVQVISVSDEALGKVESFLKRNTPGKKEMTYAELTSVYCLTTDPDGSVNEGYMRAAGQNSIPTAFIVGKTGEVEWIGHPMRMDKPLEQIVEGKYDRAAFAKKFALKQKSGLAAAAVTKLIRAGKNKEALEAADSFIANADEHTSKKMLGLIKGRRNSIALQVGGEVAIQTYKTMLEEAGDNANSISRLSSNVFRMHAAGKNIDDEVVAMACDASARAVKLAEEDGDDQITARTMNLHANLLSVCEKLEEAVAVQKKAVELSGDKRNVRLLEKLKRELEDSRN